MSDEYTPTTKNVRNLWNSRGGDPDEFDRWLAEHDREQREIAWDEAEANYYITKNPYRKG